MLQHRWGQRYRVDGSVSVKLLLPQRQLAAVARLVDISLGGMAVAAPANISGNTLIKVRYALQDERSCVIPALVIYRKANRLGLMLSLTDDAARRQHAELFERCRGSLMPRSADKNSAGADRCYREAMTGPYKRYR